MKRHKSTQALRCNDCLGSPHDLICQRHVVERNGKAVHLLTLPYALRE